MSGGKTGVYFCTCEGEIDKTVDLDSLVAEARFLTSWATTANPPAKRHFTPAVFKVFASERTVSSFMRTTVAYTIDFA